MHNIKDIILGKTTTNWMVEIYHVEGETTVIITDGIGNFDEDGDELIETTRYPMTTVEFINLMTTTH